MKKRTRFMGMFLVVMMLQFVMIPKGVEAKGDFHPVYANWMETLYQDIKDIPLYNLSMPGTHDSATYYLDNNSWDGIDNSFADFIKLEKWPVLKDIIYKFSRTQEYDVYTQLKHGNRYLDIRFKRDNKNSIRAYHGMYGKTMDNIFYQIKRFVNDNPREFVIVDLQHLHNLNNSDISKLHKVIQDTVGNKLGNGSITTHSTVKEIMNSGTRVIILTKNSNLLNKSSKYWSREENMNSEWKNTSNIVGLLHHLNTQLAVRNLSKSLMGLAKLYGAPNSKKVPLHVSQMVFSPNLDEILAPIKGGNIFKIPGVIDRWGNASIKSLTVPHNKTLSEWIRGTAKGSINIAMRDFYDKYHISFTINRNLLND